jgi:hypothetical protein
MLVQSQARRKMIQTKKKKDKGARLDRLAVPCRGASTGLSLQQWTRMCHRVNNPRSSMKTERLSSTGLHSITTCTRVSLIGLMGLTSTLSEEPRKSLNKLSKGQLLMETTSHNRRWAILSLYFQEPARSA